MEKFYEIYGYYYIPFWYKKPFKIFLLILGVLLVLVFFYGVYKFFTRKKTAELTLWERARKDLEKLNPLGLSTKAEFKKFYFDIGKILKQYLEDRYQLDLVNKTDEEIRSYPDLKILDELVSKYFLQICEGSQYVKFAGEEALPSKATDDWRTALEIIQLTIPKAD